MSDYGQLETQRPSVVSQKGAAQAPDPFMESPIYRRYLEMHETRMLIDDAVAVLNQRLTPVSVRLSESVGAQDSNPEPPRSSLEDLLKQEADGYTLTLARLRVLIQELAV